jgi:outer membrane protein TolC
MSAAVMVAIALAVVTTLASGFAAAEPARLSLRAAIELARKNPLVNAALARNRAAEARLDEARGARFPRLVVTSFIAPSPEIECEDSACTRTSPRDPLPNVRGLFGGARAELFQPIYTFGKIDAGIDASASAVRATGALAQGVQRDVSTDTARAYFGVQLSRELAAMLEEGQRQIERGRRLLAERLEQGDPEVTIQDRLRLETFQAEIATRLSEAHESEATSLFALRALVGNPQADTESSPFAALSFQPDRAETYTERARTHRPELRAAKEGALALESVERLERARFMPDLLATAGVNWARAAGVDDPPSAFANDPFNTTTAHVALLLRWTLDPVSQAARLAAADAEVARARALVTAAGQAATFAVLQAHTRVVEAHKRLEAAVGGERSARGWVLSVLQADALGTASARDLADAYLAYFTLRGRVLQSTFDFNLAVVVLRGAIGEFPLPPESSHARH